jgi:Xaa-Pro aminopeptidase
MLLPIHFPVLAPRPWQRVAQIALAGWLGLASFRAAAQTPTSIPEPLVDKPAPARPTDFLPPTFHKQRRELLRAQLSPNSVAVVLLPPCATGPTT